MRKRSVYAARRRPAERRSPETEGRRQAGCENGIFRRNRERTRNNVLCDACNGGLDEKQAERAVRMRIDFAFMVMKRGHTKGECEYQNEE